MTNHIRKSLDQAQGLVASPLFSLFVLVFFIQIGAGMIWSVIAVYGGSMGASTAMVGLIVASYGGARLLVNFPSGMASEKFGRRQMMRIGFALSATAAFSIAGTSGVGAFFACLVLLGIGSSIFVTSALAAVVDLGTPGRRMQNMSAYQAANIVGISLGPGLGGLVAGHWGYTAPFLLQGIIASCGFIALWMVSWESGRGSRIDDPQGVTGRIDGFIKQALGVGIMAFAIFYVRFASNWVILPLLAQEKFGMALSTIGLILTTGALANLFCLPFMGWAAERIGRTGLIILSSALTILGAGVLAFGGLEVFVWLASIFFGAAAGIAAPTLTAFVADVAAPDQRGPAMGLLRTMQDAAMISGPLITGILSDRLGLGYRGGLLGCILLLTVATFGFGWTTRTRKVS